MSYTKGWKKAQREAAKEAGHYDGRFAPKTFKDRQHEKDKYLCREKVEVPLEKDEEIEILDSCSDEEDQPSYEENANFSPFSDLSNWS